MLRRIAIAILMIGVFAGMLSHGYGGPHPVDTAAHGHVDAGGSGGDSDDGATLADCCVVNCVYLDLRVTQQASTLVSYAEFHRVDERMLSAATHPLFKPPRHGLQTLFA